MKNSMKNSTRLLLILKCLLEQTDEAHTMTIADINAYLSGTVKIIAQIHLQSL